MSPRKYCTLSKRKMQVKGIKFEKNSNYVPLRGIFFNPDEAEAAFKTSAFRLFLLLPKNGGAEIPRRLDAIKLQFYKNLFHTVFIGFYHLFYHLAAYRACLTGRKVAVVALLKINAYLRSSLHLKLVKSFLCFGYEVLIC